MNLNEIKVGQRVKFLRNSCGATRANYCVDADYFTGTVIQIYSDMEKPMASVAVNELPHPNGRFRRVDILVKRLLPA